MSQKITLRLDKKVQQLSLKEAAKLEFRVCCVCGLIKNAEVLEECLTCDGFMCSEHSCDEHTCDCTTDQVKPDSLTTISPTKSGRTSKK